MNPFRINFDPLHKPLLGLKDQLGKSILSLTPAHIADRISDGSLRLPAPPSGSADKVLPRWSDYAGDFKDPGPDHFILPQALDNAARRT